ncbi:LexA/Signal peptidase [Macrolepiota fuliginosa MF-IS2]|uniref:Mitochondrial inner membrane protease subunit n=1 Tax=Macrolepiota fuliginosa MF-IS2 TaxID=1400762 RepID=A0A9P5XJ95_9AGAR|nr:LexA/Signal peptidase [Macrolepiota fuliginosa MF-IS2]
MLGNLFSKFRSHSNRPLFFRKWIYWSPIPLTSLTYFYEVKQISGQSMKPTLNPDSSAWNDICLFDRYSVLLHSERDYNREDIVTLRSPDDPRRILIKRIVALEGDTVKTRTPYPEPEVKIPQGHVWVEGDESFRTDDSNLFGPVPAALIQSKLVRILWPPDRFGPISEPMIPSHRSGPAYRHAMDAIERKKTRQARVKVGRPYGVDANTY